MKRRAIATLCALVLTVAVMTSEIGTHDPVEEPDTIASVLWLPVF